MILRRRHVRSSEDDREGLVHSLRYRGSSADPREEKSALSGSQQDFHGSSTVFPQRGRSEEVEPRGRPEGRMRLPMARVLRVLALVLCVVAASRPAGAADVTLFRLFLLDGTILTSYGEFARVEDSVIFSMPVGGRPEEPRIQVTTVKSALVDWPRTDRYSASARYQRYAETRGEEDFRILSNEVALALNEIALSSNRQQALAIAEHARRTVADWPRSTTDTGRTTCAIISALRPGDLVLRAAQGATSFELSLVAMAEAPELEPVLGMPNARQQLDEIFHVASLTRGPNAVGGPAVSAGVDL